MARIIRTTTVVMLCVAMWCSGLISKVSLNSTTRRRRRCSCCCGCCCNDGYEAFIHLFIHPSILPVDALYIFCVCTHQQRRRHNINVFTLPAYCGCTVLVFNCCVHFTRNTRIALLLPTVVVVVCRILPVVPVPVLWYLCTENILHFINQSFYELLEREGEYRTGGITASLR